MPRTESRTAELAEELEQVQEEMQQLLEQAHNIVRQQGGIIARRAEAYWLAHLATMIGGGRYETTMQSTIDELREEAEGEAEEADDIESCSACNAGEPCTKHDGDDSADERDEGAVIR